ncbi:MAG: hypothetical protein NTX59_03805 [Elusimicrobia bacterium]|nr:hypothetical protein [Elusimicrobiota bacterium]
MLAIHPYLKIFFGLVFLLLGLGYVYKPEIIERLNRLLKETLLNDSYAALHRKELGLLFVLMGILLLYMGFSHLNG